MSSPASGADADGLLEFDVEFDEELLRRLARDLVLKQLGIGYLVAGMVVVCAFAALLASGDRSWIVGALGFCIAVVLLLPWFAWRLQLKQSLATLRRLDPPRVHVEAGDEDLRFTSSA